MATNVDLISISSNIINLASQYDKQLYYDVESDYIINSNVYLEYNFKNSNLLLIDSSPYAKNLVNYGGYYVSNSNTNSLFLDTSNYAIFNENNWLYQSNLSISGWFRTENFQDGDEIFDISYQSINHPIISSENIKPVQINKNEYYVAFTDTSSTNTITFLKATKCDILVVGGGGGGGGDIGGGGGAGGVVYQKGVTLASGTYTITVGAGGAARSASAVNTRNSVNGNNGNPSRIQLSGTTLSINGISYEGLGGGGGGNYNNNTPTTGNNGGSGGGGTSGNTDTVSTGGSATQGNTIFDGFSLVAGGYDGSTGIRGNGFIPGGGGGAGGTSGSVDGGQGVQINITGTNQWYAAGGGGGVIGSDSSFAIDRGGKGCNGIGGNGNFIRQTDIWTNYYTQDSKHNGTDNTGSGGGGGAYNFGPTLQLNNGGAGGSGIVIIRYILSDSFDQTFFNSSNGLVAWYKFDSNSTNMLLDSSGNGYNLTNNSATFNQNFYRTGNGSVQMTSNLSIQQYLDINSNINPYNIWNGSGITFTCWFYMSTLSGNYARIFDFSNNNVGTNPTNYIIIQRNNANFTIQIGYVINGTSTYFIPTNFYVDDNWHHISWSISPMGVWTIYIDNILQILSGTQATGTLTGTYPTTLPNATWTRRYIGRSAFSANGWYVGHIDDFRIYNRVLTALEVNSLYNIGYNIVLKKNNNRLSFELNNTSIYNTIYTDNTWNHFIWNLENAYIKFNNSSKNTYTKILPAVNRYPPSSLDSATGTNTLQSLILSGFSYGNGKYIVSASTSINASFAPKEAFDLNITSDNNLWMSGLGYNGAPGLYTGSISTIYNTNLSYLGEWLQIQLPQSIVLTRYLLVGQFGTAGTEGRGPKNFIIVGSNDGINWTLIDLRTNITGWVSNSIVYRNFDIINPKQAYMYYRICINANQGNATYGGITAIAEWQLYGYPSNYIYNNTLGSATNKGKLYLSNFTAITSNLTDIQETNIYTERQPYLYLIDYKFNGQANLLIDSSGNSSNIVSTSGTYILNENKNSLFLTNNTVANLPNINWGLSNNLTISGWFKTNKFINNDEIINFKTTNNNLNNIILKNNNNKLSFQINNNSIYETKYIQNKWNYILWNVISSSSVLALIQINDKKFYYNDSGYNLTSNNYINTIGSLTNYGELYVSDLKILNTVLNDNVQQILYTSNIYLKNNNLQLYSKDIKIYNQQSVINEYLHYEFRNQPLIGIDSSGNNRLLNNNGGYYSQDTTRNSIVLKNGTEAQIPNENWNSYSNLSISTWFKTDSFKNGDELLDFYEDPTNYIQIEQYVKYPLEPITTLLTSNNTGITSSNSLGIITRCKATTELNTTNAIWKLFDNNYYDSNYQTPATRYTTTTGLATITYYTGYQGDWIMVDLGVNIILKQIRFYPTSDSSITSPGVFRIYATNNISLYNTPSYTGWDIIHNQADGSRLATSNYIYSQPTIVDINNSSNAYRIYALVVNRLSGGGTALSLAEWELYGTEITPTVNQITPIQISGGDYYYAFTNTNIVYNMNISQDINCDVLVIGGGGSGGIRHAGGGGAGACIYLQNQNIPSGSYLVNVGSGGIISGTTTSSGINGEDTYLSLNSYDFYRAKGGGGGGAAGIAGISGGSSGGGVASSGGTKSNDILTCNIPFGGYGNKGGSGSVSSAAGSWAGGGGGGAGSVGGNAISAAAATGGVGGSGRFINITNIPTYYAAGGGGGCGSLSTAAGIGGSGIGGNGSKGATAASDGLINTGSGGGGAGFIDSTATNGTAGNGGSGIVIIRLNNGFKITENNNNQLTLYTNNKYNYDTSNILDNTWNHLLWNITNNGTPYGFIKINNTNKTLLNTTSLNLLKYPREVATGNTYAYTDGTIVRISGSTRWYNIDSILMDTHNYYRSFNNNITDEGWGSTANVYNASTDVANNTYRIGYAGEYIQIDLGESIILQSYNIYPRNSQLVRAPKTFRLYASNDSSCWTNINHPSWVLIDDEINISAYVASTAKSFTINNNNISYRYYVLIINSIFIGGFMAQIAELEFYGYAAKNYNIPINPIIWYQFTEEPTTASVINDSTIFNNKYNMTIFRSATITSRITGYTTNSYLYQNAFYWNGNTVSSADNVYLAYNGHNSYIQTLLNQFHNNYGFSIHFVFRTENIASTSQLLYIGNTPSDLIRIYIINNTLYFTVGTTQTTYTIAATTYYVADCILSISSTKNTMNLNIYIGNVLQSSTTSTYQNNLNNVSLTGLVYYIGRSATDAINDASPARIQDFRIFNYPLSRQEIGALQSGAISYLSNGIYPGMYINKLGSLANQGSLYLSDFRIITDPITPEIENRLYLSKPQFAKFNSDYTNIDTIYYNNMKCVEANSSGVAIYGNLTAIDDIVSSYSDMRLKNILSTIDNPLEKIMNIRTFKYLPNELGKILSGDYSNKIRVGVAAQDVKEVLPEVVCLAPFDTSNIDSGEIVSISNSNYLAVSYERIVPLLIECVKELNKEIRKHKAL